MLHVVLWLTMCLQEGGNVNPRTEEWRSEARVSYYSLCFILVFTKTDVSSMLGVVNNRNSLVDGTPKITSNMFQPSGIDKEATNCNKSEK